MTSHKSKFFVEQSAVRFLFVLLCKFLFFAIFSLLRHLFLKMRSQFRGHTPVRLPIQLLQFYSIFRNLSKIVEPHLMDVLVPQQLFIVQLSWNI